MRKFIVMLGTDPRAPGGMTAVVDSYRQAGLFEAWPLLFISTFHLRRTPDKLRMAAAGLWRFLPLLLAGRVLALHAHVAARGSFWRKSVFLVLARLAGRPTLLHLHDGSFPAWYRDALGPMARAGVRWMLRSVDVVVALSEGWAREILAIEPAATVKVLANPVALPAEPSARRPGRLLFMARLWPEKGVDELLQAVTRLKDRFPTLQLVCAGDGDLEGVRRRAEALGVADRLRLTGWIAGAAKQRELHEAAVFVLPSWFEGLPIGVLEAMAAGVPVVASDVGAMGEALGGVAGLLCPPRDVAALTDALERLLGDEALGARLGAQGRQRAAAVFSADRVVAALGSIYQSLGLEAIGAAGRDGEPGCAG